MRTERVVRRQNQREKLTALQEVMKASRPLMEADQQLRRAFMAGYKKRLEEEVAEAQAKLPME